MSYEYTIYAPGSMDDTIANLMVDAPLAHLQTGNSLLLNGGSAHGGLGHHVVIRHVEVYLQAVLDQAPSKTHVHVFTAEYDRVALKERLALE